MIAHDLSPRCAGGSEIHAYMDHEWNSTPGYLGDRGDGDGDGTEEAGRKPVGLLTMVVRSTRTRFKSLFL
jgi:hypothetical protein